MKTELNILIIDDSEDDTLLVLRHLQHSELTVHWDRVDTADGMRKALLTTAWDAIICDFKMPEFGPAGALSILKEQHLDIPFIITSGKMTEDRLVNLMRLGAHDVVLKDNLTRLVPAINRSITESSRQRAERKMEVALRLEIENCRASYNKTPAMLLTIDGEGRITAVTDAWLDRLGYDRGEVMGRNLTEFLIEEPRVYTFLISGNCAAAPFRFTKRNGGIADLLISAVAETDSKGRLLRSFVALTENDGRMSADPGLVSDLLNMHAPK